MKNPIFDIDNWKEITATLSRNKTRTFLTAFGIFWGTAMLALLWGGAQGAQDLLSRNFAGFSDNSAFIFPNSTTKPYRGYQKGRYWRITQTDIDNIRDYVDGIDVVCGISSRGTTVKYRDKSYNINLNGAAPEKAKLLAPNLIEGRLINRPDEQQTKKTCVIGENVARELFGTESPVGRSVEIDNIYYRVVGVMTQQSEVQINGRLEESVEIPMSTFRLAYNRGDDVDFMGFVAKRGVSPTELGDRVKRILKTSHSIHPSDEEAVSMMDISESFETINNMFHGFDILALFVGIGSLLAGIIGVGNIMWIIVKERTQEIGIRRAIGAKPRDIITQVLSESVVLTVVAGVAGVCFAALILGATAHLTTADGDVPGFQLTFLNAMVIMMLFLSLGTAAGTVPALKAMNIKPIEALNDK